MDKPRIFLGSSGKQGKLLHALTRGLEDIARVEPWTTVFNPGTTTLERLLELTREVDFAAFVFAQFIAVGGFFFAIEWGYVIAFAFFIAVMFWRPRGIFGR